MIIHHQPVLLKEVVDAFNKPLKTFVDGTLGAGGHAEAIVRAHPELECFIAIDQDTTALQLGGERLKACFKGRLILHHGNYSEIDQVVKSEYGGKVDGVLVDLGISSMQIDRPERGFSFRKEGPLDMRMNPQGLLTAKDIINEWPEEKICEILWKYGEEKRGKFLARKIVEKRKKGLIETTLQLANLIAEATPKKREKETHPATQVFQALRIAVNEELKHLELFLPRALAQLNKGGRLGVIAFHSLEDRMVKQFFAYEASDKENTVGLAGLFLEKTPTVTMVTRKPMIPSEEEKACNPRSRSARLRVVEKVV